MPNNNSFADKVKKSLSNTANDIFRPFLAGPEGGGSGTGFSQGTQNPGISGLAQSTLAKDIIFVPNSGTANSVYSYSQIDFKLLATQNSYANLDNNEIKVSLYNYGERVAGNTFDTPMLVMGGSWGGTTWAPAANWGLGTTTAIGPGFVDYQNGNGNLIYFKPASSAVYASLFNDVGLYSNQSNKTITFRAFDTPIPGSPSIPSTTVIFGGSGASNTLQIEGSTVDAQNVNVRFRSPFSVSNSTATDTLSLGLSSSASTGGTIYFSGGSRPKYVLTTESSSFSAGDIFYASGSGNTLTRVPIGNSGQSLVVSSNNIPVWSNPSSLSVTTAGTATTFLSLLAINTTASGSAISTIQGLTVLSGLGTLYIRNENIIALSTGTGLSVQSIFGAHDANTRDQILFRRSGAGAGETKFWFDLRNGAIGIGVSPTPTTEGVMPAVPSITANTGIHIIDLNSSFIRFGNQTALTRNTLGTGILFSSLKTVGVVTSGTWSATAITAHYGGTGLNTGDGFTVGDLLYANTSRTWSRLSPGSNGFILTSAGTANTPTYKDPTTVTVGLASSTSRAYGVDVSTTNANASHFLALTTSSSSQAATGLSTTDGISVNPLNNSITASTFIGSLTGNVTGDVTGNLAGFANTANNIRVIDADAGNGDHWILISTPDTGAGVAVSADSDFKFDPVKNQLSVPNITGTAFTASELTGTLRTASQNNITSASSLSTVGTISSGTWAASAIGVTYGGTGNNLSGLANTNRIPVVGANAPYEMTTISNGTSGHLMVSRGVNQAPHFTNSTTADLTFNGNLTVNSMNLLSGTIASTPSNSTDIANKSYVDSISSGIIPKGIVKYTTVAGIAASYRKASAIANSSSDIGGFLISTSLNVLDATDTGFDDLGAVSPAVGDRILIKNGITGGFGSANDEYIPFSSVPSTGSVGSSYIANGIYTIFTLGGNGTSNWILVRDTTVDDNTELRNGTYVAVDLGAVYADFTFICNNNGQPSFGSTQISFIEFSTAADFTAGQGLVKSGQIFATNINLTGSNLSNAYRTFSLGGPRTGSIGFSTWPTFTITNDSGLNKEIIGTFTNKSTGFSLAGGDISKTFNISDNLTIQGDKGLTITTADTALTLGQDSDFDVVFNYDSGGSTLRFSSDGSNIFSIVYGSGGGFGFTFDDTYTTNTGFKLSAIKNSSLISAIGQFNLKSSLSGGIYSDIYFTHNGVNQYQLSSSDSSFGAGDIFYSSGSGHTHLRKLTLSSGSGSSVLLRGQNQPVWGTINLASTNYVSGILPFDNGGTGSQASDFSLNGIVIANSNKLKSAVGLTYVSGLGLSISGTIASSGAIYSNGNQIPTGTGSVSRIAYWSDNNTLTSSNTLTYIPNASSGAALTIAPTSTSATAVRINGANSSGNLLEVLNSGTSRLSLKFDGPLTLNSVSTTDTALSVDGANSSGTLFLLKNSTTPRFYVNYDGNTTISSLGNTAFNVFGGRTLVAPATQNYASLNIPVSDSNSNPGAGNTYDGDLWYNGTNLYFQSSTELFDLLNTGTVQGTGISGHLAKWQTGTGLTHAQIIDAVGLGVTISSLSEGVGSGNGATAYLSIQSVASDETDANKFSSYYIRGIKADGTRMFSVDVSGHLRATTKSFDIPHPTKPGRRLVYGVLEGPEHGVYHRGTINGVGKIDVILPDYWSKLVGNNYTIQITPWGNYNIMIIDKNDTQFTVGLIGLPFLTKNKSYKFDYIVHGSRKDAPLDIEQ